MNFKLTIESFVFVLFYFQMNNRSSAVCSMTLLHINLDQLESIEFVLSSDKHHTSVMFLYDYLSLTVMCHIDLNIKRRFKTEAYIDY